MKTLKTLLPMILAAGLAAVWGLRAYAHDTVIKLPAPKLDGRMSLEKALSHRRSMRKYQPGSLALAEVSQLLWAAQGITEPKSGKRTAPSALGLYLVNAYVIARQVDGVPQGLYRYQPQGHTLVQVAAGDQLPALTNVVGQAALKTAPAVLILTGKTGGDNPMEWMYLEAGHAAQNVCLQAVALKLGTVTMGGFKPELVKTAMHLPDKEQPVYLMPVGRE